MSDAYEHMDWAEDIKGLTVVDGEFVVATADGSDKRDDSQIASLLERVRDHVGMDIVFISQFAGGERIIRHAFAKPGHEDVIQVGERDPVEETFCKQVVDGRQPEMAGRMPDNVTGASRDAGRGLNSYITVPLSAHGGAVFGTLCCASRGERPELGGRSELQAVRSVAQLLSKVISTSA